MLSYFHPMASSRCANLLMYTENAYSGGDSACESAQTIPHTVRLVLNCDLTLFHNSPELSIQTSPRHGE